MGKRQGAMALQKAQCNLMRKMGLVDADSVAVSDEDLERYFDSFKRVKSDVEVGALALLFNIQISGVGEVC